MADFARQHAPQRIVAGGGVARPCSTMASVITTVPPGTAKALGGIPDRNCSISGAAAPSALLAVAR